MIRMILGRVWKLVPQKRFLNSCSTAHAYLDHYVDQVLDRAKTSPNGLDIDNMHTQKLSMIEGLSVQSDDRTYIRSQILQGMMASQETTSALLGNAFLLLSRHPQYWMQLRQETAEKDVNVMDFDALLNFAMAQNILSEALRLYPIFPIMSRGALRDTTLTIGSGENVERSKSLMRPLVTQSITWHNYR